MCDTQVVRHRGRTFFAKNSDREADEPQYIRYYPSVVGDMSHSLQTTYIEIEQVPDRYAVILSQPSWIWGAEMGVNEHGLVIGNEAVFTRVVNRANAGLLGMDILRIVLERCRSAETAIRCIDHLLSQYGQGGPAGYRDKEFKYDSSFIIADACEAWVLETAGRHWVARRVERFDAISNALSISDNFDLHSDGLHDYAKAQKCYSGRGKLDFARAFDTRFMRFMGKASQRRACSLRTLGAMIDSPGMPALAASLRMHASDRKDFSRHGNADVCMHAGGVLRPSQTTGSMLVSLNPDAPPDIFLTGTSAPCLSLFQPLSFPLPADGGTAFPDNTVALWHQFEAVHHKALVDPEFCRRLRTSRDALEPALFDDSLDIIERRAQALEWHNHWFDQARSTALRHRWYSPYDRFWRAKRKALQASP